MLGRGGGRISAFEGPFPGGRAPEGQVGEIDGAADGDAGLAGREIRDELPSFQLDIQHSEGPVGHRYALDGLGIITFGGEGDVIGTCMQWPVVCACDRLGVDPGAVHVMVLDVYLGVKRVAGGGVGHGALQAVERLFHVIDERPVVVIPQVGQLGCRQQLDIRDLQGKFPALVKEVHVILPAAADGIPGIAVGDAVVESRHVSRRRKELGRIGILVTHQLPPVIVGMQVGPRIPGIVANLRAAMEVGPHQKLVLFSQRHERQGLLLPFVAVGVRAVLGVGVVPVEVDPVGIVADGAVHGAVAAEVGAIGVGQGIDPDVEVVHQRIHFRVAAIMG